MNYTAHSEKAERPRARAALLRALGLAVRERRSERGLTLRELGRRAGVSERFLVQLESGDGNISVARLEDVGEALGTTAAALLAEGERGAAPRGVIALVGLRGAGKSTVGKAVAKKLGIPFVELDALVAQEAGMTLSTIFEVHGEEYFRRAEREVLTRLLEKEERAVVATSGSIVNDRETWALLRDRTTTVWLKAKPEDHWERVVAQGDGRPMAGRPRAMAELRAIYAARKETYARARVIVETSGVTAVEAAARVAQAVC